MRIIEWARSRRDAFIAWFFGDYQLVPSWESGIVIGDIEPPSPPAPVAVVELPKRKPKAVKAARPEDRNTLSGLLDEVEKTFDSLARKTCGGSFTHPELRLGLRRLGPHVPVNRERTPVLPNTPKVVITPKTKFSSLIFVARNNGRYNDKEFVYPDFAYASRLQKLPWDAEQLPGIAYECGLAFRYSTGKLFWIGFFAVVDPVTGDVRACHQLQQETVRVAKHGDYVRKKWGVSLFAAKEWGKTDDERNIVLAGIFAETFSFWQEKESMWSVSVRKDGRRVTFCVEPSDTKRYFKDRDKTALTPTGKRKTIIHFVTEHSREVEAGKVVTVREHIRGLRQFYWRGFDCAVTAPQFHRWAAQAFDVPQFLDDDVEPTEKTLITADQMGSILADMEDQQQPWSTHAYMPKSSSLNGGTK